MTTTVLLTSPDHSCLLQSLQQRNLELLSVVRQLGSEKENEAAAVQAAKEGERKHVEEELSAIQAENARVQVGERAHSPAWPYNVRLQTGIVECDAEWQSKRLQEQHDCPGCWASSVDCKSLVSQQHSNMWCVPPQSLFEQVVRQRDLFKRLLDEAGAPGNSQPGQLSLPAPEGQAIARAEVQPHHHVALNYVKAKGQR